MLPPFLRQSTPVGVVGFPSRLGSRIAVRSRALRTRRILELDYRDFRRRYGELLDSVPVETTGTALLASLTYSPFQLKLEGMLAKAFQLHGLEPVAAVPADGRMPRRYLELFGVRRFVRLEDYLTPELEDEARREGEALLEGVREPDDLRRLTFRGVDVGRQALSTVSRYLHEGGVDLADAEARELLGRLLPSAVRSTLAFERLLDDVAARARALQRAELRGPGPALRPRARPRVERRPVRRRVRGRHARASSASPRRRRRSTRARSPTSRGRACGRCPGRRAAGARARGGLLASATTGATFLARWNQGWTRPRTRGEVVARARARPEPQDRGRLLARALGREHVLRARPLRRPGGVVRRDRARGRGERRASTGSIKLHPANVWKRKRDGVTGELDELVAIREHVGELPPHVRVLEPDERRQHVVALRRRRTGA